MNYIYTAKYLVSGDAPPIESGALLAHDGRITAIGTINELKRNNRNIEIVDFADALLVPLLVNAHTHLELTDFSQWARNAGINMVPESFVDWLLQLIRIKQKLDEKQYHRSLTKGIEQSIKAGTGAIGDVLAYYAARTIYQNFSLQGCLFLETLGQAPEIIQQQKKNLEEVLKNQSIGTIELGISPHSPYTISSNYLRNVYTLCQHNGLRCTTHVAESPDEVEFVKHSCGNLAERLYSYIGWKAYVPPPSGLRPVEYLLQQGGLFPGNLLVHGVQLNNTEIELLAEKQMYLALCPRSNAGLKVGKAPAGKLYKAGVKLALGTDSLASCDSLSIWDEMAFAHRWFEGELDAPTLFSMATLGGAEALGLQKKLGSLSIGKQAGFQVLRPKISVAADEIFDYFVSPGRNEDIVQIYHQGQPQLPYPD